MPTKKVRQGPTESATKFSVGTKKRGNDGNIWQIISTTSGTRRWMKVGKKQVTRKNKVSLKHSNENKSSSKISLDKLKKLNKKYYVTTSGTKEELALRLWKVGSTAVTNKDLLIIGSLLPKKEKQEVEKLVNKRNKSQITNYKGMWEPLPKPLSKMNRDELIKQLKKFRDAWEKITTRNQHLSNERLESETDASLRSLLKFYYSNDAKLIAEDFLNKK